MADFPFIDPLYLVFVYKDNCIYIRSYLHIETPDNNTLTYNNTVSTNGVLARTHNYDSTNGTPASSSIVSFEDIREDEDLLVCDVVFPVNATQDEISQGVIIKLAMDFGDDFKFTRTAAWLEAGKKKGVTSTISKTGSVIIT